MKLEIFIACLSASASAALLAVVPAPSTPTAAGPSPVPDTAYSATLSVRNTAAQRNAQEDNSKLLEHRRRLASAGKSEAPQETSRAYGVLPNGLRYLIERRTGENVSVWLAVGIGNAAETPEETGVAHLIEHMAFNELRHWPRGAYRTTLTREGVRWDGNTGQAGTWYGLHIPSSSTFGPDEAIGIIRDWADGIVIDDSSVSLEKEVVIAEGAYGASLDNYRQLAEILLNNRYSESEHGASVRAFTPELVRAFYDKWYQPSLMTVVVVGDIDIEGWKNSIERKLASIRESYKPIDVPRLRPAAINNAGRLFAFESANKAPTVYSSIIQPADEFTKPEDILREEIRSEIAGKFLEARTKSSGFTFHPNVNFSVLHGMGPYRSKNLILETAAKDGKYLDAIEGHLRFIEQTRKYPITKAEFEHTRGLALRNFASQIDEPVTIARFYAYLTTYLREDSRYLDRNDRRKIFDTVSLPEMQSYIEGIVQNQVQSAIAVPQSQMATFDLAPIRREVEALRVDPPKPPADPGPIRAYLDPKLIAAPRPTDASVTPSQPLQLYGLPGGHSLIVARPKEVSTSQGISLRAIAPRAKSSGAIPASGAAIPVAVLPEGKSMADWQIYAELHQLRASVRPSESTVIFGIDAAPGSEDVAFALLSLARRHPEFVKPAAGEGQGQPLAGNLLSSLATEPIKLIVSGFVDSAEIPRWAEISLGEVKTAHSPRCALDGAKIARSVSPVPADQWQPEKMRVSFRISGTEPAPICLRLLHQTLLNVGLEELRYNRGISYSGGLGKTSEIVDGTLILNFMIPLSEEMDRDVRRRFSEGVRALVNAWAEGKIDRDQFAITKKQMAEGGLSRSSVPSHLADELSQALLPGSQPIARYEDGFSAEQIEYSEIAAMAKTLFNGVQNDVEKHLHKYQAGN